MKKVLKSIGFLLQETSPIYVASIPGRWLLEHATPSWRIKDPKKGFQRVVKEDRARRIALAVLDQQRTFPNSIVLATNTKDFKFENGKLELFDEAKFLVVDGQHRLWAQNFSDYDANYSCNIHCDLSEIEMARLFLEINDTQKRVPSSLRWDLVRLVRPNDDPYAIEASDIIYSLATEETSPLFQRIDLTGEQAAIQLKQGSLAPELKYIFSKAGSIKKLDVESKYEFLEKYFTAIKNLDSTGWHNTSSNFYQARVLRMLVRLLIEIVSRKKGDLMKYKVSDFNQYLKKIDKDTLETQKIKAKQGAAGMREIYNEIRSQVFSG
jgi:DGQHR domain-containing protein